MDMQGVASTAASASSEVKGKSEGGKRAGLANLRPFKKGVSGNPGGRGKHLLEIQALARQHSPRAFARIVELVEDPDPRVAIVAAKEVLDRAYGKSKPMDDDADDKKSVTINIIRYADGNTPPVIEAAKSINVRKFCEEDAR